jgi:hypothetical protein
MTADNKTIIPEELLCSFVDGTTTAEEDKLVMGMLTRDRSLAEHYKMLKTVASDIEAVEDGKMNLPDEDDVLMKSRLVSGEKDMMCECCCVSPDVAFNKQSPFGELISAPRKRPVRRESPNNITRLNKNEIFVFGSNRYGYHTGGASLQALKKFGAKMHQGEGLQGSSYAIPTMQGGVETIVPYVNRFIDFAKAHPELKFLVTRIGCGTAGFEPADIAPLFVKALDVKNIYLPHDFLEIIGD